MQQIFGNPPCDGGACRQAQHDNLTSSTYNEYGGMKADTHPCVYKASEYIIPRNRTESPVIARTDVNDFTAYPSSLDNHAAAHSIRAEL